MFKRKNGKIKKRNKVKFLLSIKSWICAILVLLILSVVGAFIAALKIDNVSFLETLSGVSSFFVAILTALYVFTTSKQIDVANKQLEEMKNERATNELPLVVLKQDFFEIERPKFYYAPCDNEYSFQSRYMYGIKLINKSTFPALWIDISAELLIPKGEDLISLDSCQHRINLLSSLEESEEVSIMFVSDEKTELFTSLRERSAKDLPLIRLTIYYRNLCGGYFRTVEIRRITPSKEIETKIVEWQKQIITSQTVEKEALDYLSEEKEQNKNKQRIFKEIQTEFERNIKDKKNIRIETREIPTLYEFNVISKNEYLNCVEKYHYPQYVHKSPNCQNKMKNKE